jgi:CMP-N-acetylneuraminic acid synthetase
MSDIISLICARGGSKGLPRKNVRPFVGKPLIAHSIEMALNSNFIADVVVSTDDEEISRVAKNYGASVPFMRPANLSGDSAPEWHVWQHALSWLSDQGRDIEALVVLPPTAPLRSLEDVNGAIEMFLQKKCDGVVCGTDAHRNPFFNMVTIDDNQRCALAMSGAARFTRRQDAPTFYDLTTVCYVMSPDYITHHQHLFDGDIRMFHVPVERSVDIDTIFDFELAEFIHQKTLKNVHE